MTTIGQDTICAVSTPYGVGGIAVIRVSGNDACAISDRIWKGKSLQEVDSHTAHLGYIIDNEGIAIDQAVATVFRAPASFTGENVVEISVHGSKWVQREVLRLLIENGARMAHAGEFSRRAYANGKMDLAEVEGVADMIASQSRAANRIAMTQMKGEFSRRLKELHDKLLKLVSLMELELDFSEEEVEFASRSEMLSMAEDLQRVVDKMAASFSQGNAIKEGVPVAIVGSTNAGKSTLLNALLQEEKAIVSDIHGTTRDIIEDTVEIEDVAFRFIDTAGLRKTDDTIEGLGIERALERMRKARIVIWVVDAQSPHSLIKETARLVAGGGSLVGDDSVDDSLIGGVLSVDSHVGCASVSDSLAVGDAPFAADQSLIVAVNKCDISDATATIDFLSDILPTGTIIIPISAKQEKGLDQLQKALVDASGVNRIKEGEVLVTNLRHYEALTLASTSIKAVINGLKAQLPGDLIAQDARETLLYLGEITGTITSQDILNNIFSHFCIGK